MATATRKITMALAEDFNPWSPDVADVLPAPTLWRELGDPRDRATVGGLAFALLARDPQPLRDAFVRQLLEALGARAQSASPGEEHGRLQALQRTVTLHMASLYDLHAQVTRVLALATTLAAVRERVQPLEDRAASR